MFAPSILALFVTGILWFLVTMFFLINLKTFTMYQKLKMILFIGILIGIHGLQHLGAEMHYNFNPLKKTNEHESSP